MIASVGSEFWQALSFAFAMFWLGYCVYSWVIPPLVRRWTNRKWGS